jgi:dynactin 1
VAPWVQRASDMKAEVVMNHDMERKLQQHSDEIMKLIKDIKFKVIQSINHMWHL